MADNETSTAAQTATPVADDAWLQLLRVTTAAPQPQEAPAPPSNPRFRRLATGALLGLTIALVVVVRAELATVPDGALAGLLLRVQIKMAEAQSTVADYVPSTNRPVTEVRQRPLPATRNRHLSKAKAQVRRHNRSVPVSSRPVLQEAKDDTSSTVAPGELRVLPLRPLRPFEIEVVSGGRHRLLASRQSGVHVDIFDQESLLRADYQRAGALQATRGPATLRALISPEGRIEDLWLIQGPPPTIAALHTIRRTQYPPFMVNGTPVEMEALIIMGAPWPASPPDGPSSNATLR